jgi:septal ring factor EnvC (AmiA/AmiB activator)
VNVETIIVIMNSLMLAVLGWLWLSQSEIRAGMKDRLREQADEIKEVRDDLNHFKAQVPHQYVMREDFIRSVSVLDHKMDRFGEELTTLNKNVSRLLGGDGRGATS